MNLRRVLKGLVRKLTYSISRLESIVSEGTEAIEAFVDNLIEEAKSELENPLDFEELETSTRDKLKELAQKCSRKLKLLDIVDELKNMSISEVYDTYPESRSLFKNILAIKRALL
ncbi:MAG: hypothetical protein ACKOW9_02665 [Candidatus Paceibacterota bacterium]